MDTSGKFVVVAVNPDNAWTNTRHFLNPHTTRAETSEEAIANHRERVSDPRYTIYALPLADFIKHATPEKRDYKVTVGLTVERNIVSAVGEAEAVDRAISGLEIRYGRGLDWKITNVEVTR